MDQKYEYDMPGGYHADSRAFSAYSPRIFRARALRGQCTENMRQRYAYFPRIFRVFSAHSPRNFRALKNFKKDPFFYFSKFFKILKSQKKIKKIKNIKDI